MARAIWKGCAATLLCAGLMAQAFSPGQGKAAPKTNGARGHGPVADRQWLKAKLTSRYGKAVVSDKKATREAPPKR